MDFQSSDKKNIWHPFTPLEGVADPLLVESAKGVYLHLKDNRKIIDAVSSWWVNIHGHSNPVIANAIGDQAKKLEHVIFADFTHEPAIRLSKNESALDLYFFAVAQFHCQNFRRTQFRTQHRFHPRRRSRL